MIKFRGKFRAMLLEKLRRGELVVPADTTAARLRSLLNKLGRTAWNVKILQRYDHGDGVATYLANYLKGGPIGNHRLLSQRDGRVHFRYRVPASEGQDRNRHELTSLSVDQFLGRFLEHVPPRGYQTVRGYGLYCGNQHSRLDKAHRALGCAPPESDREPMSWEEFCQSAGVANAGKCPECGTPLVAHSDFERGRAPPPRLIRLLNKQRAA